MENPRLHLCMYVFMLHCAAHRILVSQPGIEPVTPALGPRSLNQRTATEVPGTALCTDYVVSLMAMFLAKLAEWSNKKSKFHITYIRPTRI